MKYDVKNRYNGEVKFTAEIECEEGDSEGFKVGRAVIWALRNGADLGCADLQGADLGGADFRGADFDEADLAGAYLEGAEFRGAYLRGADLAGADLRGADLGGADFQRADLQGADLREADLRGADLRSADFRSADFEDVDFRGADLREADLRGASLLDADFRGADFEGADLSGAHLRSADFEGAALRGAKWGAAPRIENIHQAVYDACTQSDQSLNMEDWHTCDTTHCRAGWVVTLAGKEGKKLEGRIGTPAAALAIYATSDPGYFSRDGIPDFYCDNKTALADMKRLADLERA